MPRARGHAVKGSVGAARAGRTPQIRVEGFGSDVAYLTRLRSAIVMDGTLPRDEKAQALRQLDELVGTLANLTHRKVERQTA